MRLLARALGLTIAFGVLPAPVVAQEAHHDGYVVSGRAGVWMFDGRTPAYGSIATGLRFGDHVVVDLEYAGVNLEGSACDAGAAAPGGPATVDDCGDDTWLKMLTLAPRIEFTGVNSRPYVGLMLGATGFRAGSGIVGGRVGVMQEVTDGTSLLFEGSWQLVGVQGTFNPVTALAIGLSHRL